MSTGQKEPATETRMLVMLNENFGFAGSDDDQTDHFQGGRWARPEDRNQANSVNTEALERWLVSNYSLWTLGLRLAATARQHRREYRNLPFNQSGWFSPN
jgi:hypothetical protein